MNKNLEVTIVKPAVVEPKHGSEKRCPKCKETKKARHFYYNKKTGRLSSRCRQCHLKDVKSYESRNSEKMEEYRAEYRIKNAKKIAKYQAEYFDEHRDYLLEYQKEYMSREDVKQKNKIRAKTRQLIKSGMIEKPEVCHCGNCGPLEAHHTNGYTEKGCEWDVLFLCPTCHGSIHTRLNREAKKAKKESK